MEDLAEIENAFWSMEEKISVVGGRPGNHTWPERSSAVKFLPPLKGQRHGRQRLNIRYSQSLEGSRLKEIPCE